MQDVPRSKRFDDIYFSKENGLEESRFVFLQGNLLEERLPALKNITIAETGFGTGLNFLALWDLAEKTNPEIKIHYVSYEQYPLDKEAIRGALTPWSHIFSTKIDTYLNVYPMEVPGFHTIYVTDNIKLSLVFGDINETLPQTQNIAVDAWFLDGFTPAKNPEMWTETVFRNMARLSAKDATFATFTSAGFVKRGLHDAGFQVEKSKGFSNKRERLIGYWQGEGAKVSAIPKKVAIIGGGLAGCAAAYWLGQEGAEATIFEKGPVLAGGASGNPIGMVNPRFYKFPEEQGLYYMAAYSDAVTTYKNLAQSHDFGFRQCGALHLCTDEEKQERFEGLVENWCLPKHILEIVDAGTASELANIPLDKPALHLPQSAMVSPAALCQVLVNGSDVRLNTEFQQSDMNSNEYDAVVLTCGTGFKGFDMLNNKDLHTVRGQLTLIEATEETRKLQKSIHYGGYISPEIDNGHAVGATYQKWLDTEEAMEEDNAYNIEKLREAVSLREVKVIDARASMRVTTKQRFPLFGNLEEGVYCSLAHGSHGLSTVLKTTKALINPLEKSQLSL